MAIEGVHRHPDQGIVCTSIQRPEPSTVEKFRTVYSAFLLDHLGKHGVMDARIKPLATGMNVCGPAVTALGPDLSVRRMAINLAEPGDVLVVAAGGFENRACFGDGTALRMARKGMNGVVIDGMTRDRDGVVELGFPTFCRGATPRNFHYPEDGQYGSVNVPVVCGGAVVHPGDLVLGDGDGVVVVPRRLADSIVDDVVAGLAAERQQRDAMVTFVPFPVEDELRALGYRFVDGNVDGSFESASAVSL